MDSEQIYSDDTKVEVEVLPGRLLWEAKQRHWGGEKFITTFKRAQSLKVKVLRSVEAVVAEPRKKRAYRTGLNRMQDDSLGFDRAE